MTHFVSVIQKFFKCAKWRKCVVGELLRRRVDHRRVDVGEMSRTVEIICEIMGVGVKLGGREIRNLP